MISINEAEARLIRALPTGSVVKAIVLHEDKYLSIAHFPDADEGFFDPFFSIDKETGEFRDFSPQDYPDPLSVIKKLQRAIR